MDNEINNARPASGLSVGKSPFRGKFMPRRNRVSPIRVIFLGGLNQIGKNITVVESETDIIIIDCGTAFPDGEMLGIDLVIPDFSYLESKRDKIRGLIVTHGHEDHIGAVPYLLKKMNIPIYATPLTMGLISSKLKERKLIGNAKLFTYRAGQNFNVGCFNVEFIHVNHSIPDAVALCISTPCGKIVHTGDFKIDCTPSRGPMIDLARFSVLGSEKVLLLMADSTNADRTGYTNTEKNINESFENLFNKAGDRRIIIATFASNIGRIQQIIDCAVRNNRKVMFSGRSMLNYVSIATELKYISAPDGVIVDIDHLGDYNANEVVLVTTGSQGEPMSALYNMAFSQHKKVEVGPNDFIIISAHPIPGNEKMVNNVVNELMNLGCEVIYESMYEVHVSGHACQEELKIIHGLVKPRFFIPVHGECKHLKRHSVLAKHMGMQDSSVYVGGPGDIVEITPFYMKCIGKATCETVMVDGSGVGDVGSVVLNDRKHLSQEGIIVVVAAISIREKVVKAGPDIISRGFVYVKGSEGLMSTAKRIAFKSISSCFDDDSFDWSNLRTKCRDDLYKYFHDKTHRRPIILPVIMEV